MSIHSAIIRSCLVRPFRVRIHDDRRAYRGIDVLVGAWHMARAIDRQCRSQTVGILLPTSGAFPISALASWVLGKAVVPLNYLLARDELEYVIRDSGIDTIVTAGPMLEFLGYEPKGAGLLRMDQVAFRGIPEPRWPRRAEPDDLAALLYTSGTSGRPKGVMLTHGNITANMRQVREHIDCKRSDVLFGVLPQFHSFGFTVLTLMPLAAGMRTAYAAKFVPAQVVRLLREHRPTILVAIPSMYGALLRVKDAKPEDFASLRYIISGGEPLPREVADRFRERFGRDILEGYGLTETSPVTHVNRIGQDAPGTVGTAVPGVRTRIVDLESGNDVPPGGEGEIRLDGPNIFKGYYHLPEETAAAFDDQGSFRTGDIGRIDSNGRLAITGRLKEMLIVGGENVFPREIEEAIDAFPGIVASGVIGTPDPMRGEVPVAFVELGEGVTLDETALRAHCRTRLAGYKVPRDIHAVDAMPRGPTGKILRRKLREMLPKADTSA